MPEITPEDAAQGTPLTHIHETAKKALDALALALAEHKHVWTDEERSTYEQAIALLS